MFEFVRTHQRLMQFFLLLLIIPSFAFVGLGSYTRFRDDGNAVAKVAGQSITQQELDGAVREQMDRIRRMYREQFDPKLFDTPEARQNILDELIAKRVLNAEAVHANLTVPDQALQKAIISIPGLTKADGKFDHEGYAAVLSAQGMTELSYEARMRKDMAMQQLNGAVQSSAFAPKSLAVRLSDLSEQEREVQELPFKLTDFLAQAKVTDDMLKAYYDKNTSQFEIPEQAKAEYLVLTRDTVEEQRRASHILIKVEKGASDADRAAAKAKAEKLLAQVRKTPGDFAKLAKENSQDPSAEAGGDLDFFGKGMMTKPFEDAVYKLKQGEISDVVETEFGYHIVQLTGIKPNVAALMDMKKFSELAETFSNMVYEQADSLKPAADKLNLKIETVSDLTRQPNAALSPKLPYNNAKFLKALFSDDAIKNKHNTEVVEVAPNTLVAGHIVEYKAASQRPFDEVKALVRERVTRIEAAKLAKQAGEAKLAALKAKDDTAGFADAKTISRTKKDLSSSEAFVAVMKADTRKLPAYVGVEVPGTGYSVFRIGKVAQPAKPDEARRQAEQQQVTDALAQQEMMAYIDVLKQKTKTKILKPIAAVEATPAEADAQSSSAAK